MQSIKRRQRKLVHLENDRPILPGSCIMMLESHCRSMIPESQAFFLVGIFLDTPFNLYNKPILVRQKLILERVKCICTAYFYFFMYLYKNMIHIDQHCLSQIVCISSRVCCFINDLLNKRLRLYLVPRNLRENAGKNRSILFFKTTPNQFNQATKKKKRTKIGALNNALMGNSTEEASFNFVPCKLHVLSTWTSSWVASMVLLWQYMLIWFSHFNFIKDKMGNKCNCCVEARDA